jgi:hypothetical protein
MEWLVFLLIPPYLLLLLLIFAVFYYPLDSFNKNIPKPTNSRERIRFVGQFFFFVLFPWLLMYGGVRYFNDLLTGLNL